MAYFRATPTESTPTNLSSFSLRSGRLSFRQPSILSASCLNPELIRLDSLQPCSPPYRLFIQVKCSIRSGWTRFSRITQWYLRFPPRLREDSILEFFDRLFGKFQTGASAEALLVSQQRILLPSQLFECLAFAPAGIGHRLNAVTFGLVGNELI